MQYILRRINVNSHFKPHIQKMKRYQTSLGRDLDNGIRLDRNEKVSNFTPEFMEEIFSMFKPYSLSASPEAESLYNRIAISLDVPENKIFITSGITEGIRVIYDMCARQGDNVICLDPTYPMYSIYADMYQLEYRKFHYNTTTLKPDIASLYDQIDRRTKFVIIPNPNLPIESCFTIEEIKKVAIKCKENGTILIVDEAYHFFGAPSTLDLVNEFDNFIVFRTFSKAYGLAGLRIGFMVSNPNFIEYISKSRSIVESNTLTMKIAEYFLTHPEIRDAHVKEVKEGSAYIQKKLTEMGIKWHGGNYTNGILIFLKNKAESEEVVAHFKSKKIYIRGAFEAPFDSSIRVSIGSSDLMRPFIKEMKKWITQ